MTSSSLLAASALLALLLTGCASPADTDSTAGIAAPTERIYRTGSNIPVKDPKPLTAEERERQAEAARAAVSGAPR